MRCFETRFCCSFNTRIEGAHSGQYDYVDAVPVDVFDCLKSPKATKPVLMEPFGRPVLVNTTEESMGSRHARTTVRMALSMEDMLEAAFGNSDIPRVTLKNAWLRGFVSIRQYATRRRPSRPVTSTSSRRTCPSSAASFRHSGRVSGTRRSSRSPITEARGCAWKRRLLLPSFGG
jgi:hypothetical protein